MVKPFDGIINQVCMALATRPEYRPRPVGCAGLVLRFRPLRYYTVKRLAFVCGADADGKPVLSTEGIPHYRAKVAALVWLNSRVLITCAYWAVWRLFARFLLPGELVAVCMETVHLSKDFERRQKELREILREEYRKRTHIDVVQ
jgi:hypothetical protein